MLNIAASRLDNQQIEGAQSEEPGDVVRRLGAVQAQDYLASLWAVGLRMKQTTEAVIEQAIVERKIVRTWPMRGTLHFVAPEDIRWMLKLMTPRVIARSAGRHKQLELDEATFAKSADLFARTLAGGKLFTRGEMYEALERANISTAGQRGYHILSYLAQNRLLCVGPHRDKQPTFTLLDEWLPVSRTLEPDEALAEIVLRYFTGHGPATLQDFVRWTGLLVTEAKAGLDAVKAQLVEETIDGETYWRGASSPEKQSASPTVHLLPAFDEYLVGYKERSAVLDPADEKKVIPGKNGMFNPVIVIDGKIAGTWKRTFKKGGVVIETNPFRHFSDAENDAFNDVAQRYGEFLGLPVSQLS